MGAHVGRLERSTAQALLGYLGPVAVMSFNPHSVLQMASLAPDVPRGLTSGGYRVQDWPYLPKVTRDRLMVEAEETYPGYNFARHKGYPTKAHFQRLNELGPCPIHRRSFAPVAQASMFPSGGS